MWVDLRSLWEDERPKLRAPLFVTTRTLPVPPAPDIYPNIAVKFQTATPSGTYWEPQLYPKPPQAPDIYPNLAVRLQTIQPAGRYLDPPSYLKVPPAPDTYPNLAVNRQTQRPAGTYIDPVRYNPVPPSPDLYPNLAVNLQTVMTWPGGEPVTWKVRPLQTEQAPNLAIITPPVGVVIPAPIDPQISRPPFAQPDLYPNLSAKNETVTLARVPFYTATWKTTPPQIDILPNLALRLPPPGVVIPAPIDPQLAKRIAPQIDLFTNVALLLTPSIGTITVWDDLPRHPLYQFDLYPNLAVVGAPLATVLRAPLYTVTWRAPAPQIDLLPNLAIAFSVAAPVVITDPWPVHWPMPPVSKAQLKKYIEQQRRAATRRARQIAAQVKNDQELRETLEKALRREIPIETVLAESLAKPPVPLRKVDWEQVKIIANRLLEKAPPIPPIRQIQLLEALPDPEEAEIGELSELQSLYAQDFYERIEALRRLIRKKLN